MIIGYYILTHPGICIYGVGRGCVMRVWCQMLFYILLECPFLLQLLSAGFAGILRQVSLTTNKAFQPQKNQECFRKQII